MRTALLAIGLALVPSALAAQVTENATITNRYNYQVGDQTGSGSDNGGTTTIDRVVTSSTGVSEMGLSLTGTLDAGSFYFLHDGACVGVCSMSLVTEIVFELTNLSNQAVDLRFDSQITPGHLANSFLEPGTNSTANFDFTVAQEQGIRQGLIYSADGTATTGTPVINTSDGQPFNNLLYDSNDDPNWNVLDWSATNLSLQLATIAPNASTSLTYRSILTIATSQTDCLDPTQCESLQVAFGDPRNAGGVRTLSSLSSFFAAPQPTGSSPAVGAEFDPFQVYYQFVDVGSPTPPPPLPTGNVDYDINYSGPLGAVPEPSTWLTLLLGFFLIGGILRRQRKLAFA